MEIEERGKDTLTITDVKEDGVVAGYWEGEGELCPLFPEGLADRG